MATFDKLNVISAIYTHYVSASDGTNVECDVHDQVRTAVDLESGAVVLVCDAADPE